METIETTKQKYMKILKDKKITKKKKPKKNWEFKKLKIKKMKKKPTWKRMKCVFFLQTSNLHRNNQKYKSEKQTLYFYYTKE